MVATQREMFSPQEPVDLTNCEREPIHLLGKIQPDGFLVAVSSDWIIQFVSENIAEFVGVNPEEILGTPLSQLFIEASLARFRSALRLLNNSNDLERIFNVSARKDGPQFDVTLTLNQGRILIECEPSIPSDATTRDASVRVIISRLNAAPDVNALCHTAARMVKMMTGFDRVMIYKFLHDGSGEVVAEAKQDNLESFLDLRYPASDIPKQARELYKKNLIRIIANVNGKTVPITPQKDPHGQILDLSTSVLRSVSPIHIEYLQNMGVGASMSVSILLNGELWGLVACHHMTAIKLDVHKRVMAELVGQMLSLALESRERREDLEDTEKAQTFHEHIMRTVASSQNPLTSLTQGIEDMRVLLKADGAALYVDGDLQLFEKTPSPDEFKDLVRFLNRTASATVFHTYQIENIYEPGRDFISRAAGLLAIPVSRRPRDYLVFFRQEISKSVKWAGNPEKAVSYGPNGARLTPRKSFETWQQTVQGQSEPWTRNEIRLAESLRHTLLEVVLRQTDFLEKERKAAQEKQELLIAELNHRVRNILSLIRGLISQSQNEQKSTEDFVDTLDDRIRALARAHDQITKQNWSPGSVIELIKMETDAYLGDKADKIRIYGEDFLLQPEAFSTLALVIHELTTNSAKYGALSDPAGIVEIALSSDGDSNFVLRWNERNGPPVHAPTRRGFGSTIIERSIPHSLKGESEIRYLLGGVEARLLIPVRLVADNKKQAAKPVIAKPKETAANIRLNGHVLLVEDNLIIALDTEAMVETLGASKVHTASHVAEAKDIIDQHNLSFAFLDINLGDTTSFPIAEILLAKGVPFIFTSGYGDDTSMPENLRAVPRVSKPFDIHSLRTGIAATGAI